VLSFVEDVKTAEVSMRSGDEADFTAFVSATSRRLLRTAYLLTGDAETAQDLLQTALERAYRRWGLIGRTELPEAYVRRVIVNAATDRRRAGRRVRTVELDESHLPALAGTAEEALAARDALSGYIRKLPAGQRAILVLRYFDDLTEAETARTLGCSVGTVKSQHARAIARLRELMPDRRPS
jgi:RNA polymerase sigma-70 factor (sigma-E family)